MRRRDNEFDREYEFKFDKTFDLHYPPWVYVTTALSVVWLVVEVVLRFA